MRERIINSQTFRKPGCNFCDFIFCVMKILLMMHTYMNGFFASQSDFGLLQMPGAVSFFQPIFLISRLPDDIIGCKSETKNDKKDR